MIRSRLTALAMLVTAALTLLPAPSQAAPAGVEGGVSLRDLTLPAGGGTVDESLGVLLFAGEPGWADKVTLTIDTSKALVADVAVSGEKCSNGPVVRCVLPGPHRVYQRPTADGGYSYTTFALVSVSLTPRPGAPAGDTGTWSVATKVDDGPARTETATIRIGEGVNLTAVDDKPRTVAPGGAVALRPRVRNGGPAEVGGLTAVLNADEGALDDTSFGNCTYGYVIACTFDTTLTVGATYRMSAPFTVRVPRDAAAASRTSLGVQWLTAAEWQDWQADYGDPPDGRAGTGPDLDLELEPSLSAAAVPQADTDQDDNGSYTTVTVAGGRRTDVVAIGATIPGTAGDHTISVGFVNRGPGTLRFPPFADNVPSVRVTLPEDMSVVTADESCTSLADDPSDLPPSEAPAAFQPQMYDCAPRSVTFAPGRDLMFSFTVRAARAVPAQQGSVQVDLFGDVDRDSSNNQATITVTAAGRGLPITGSTPAAIAGGGLLLAIAGAAVVVLLRRRRSPVLSDECGVKA
jgi:hypothetical protein